MSNVYHVTYVKHLASIAQKGLTPRSSANFSGYAAHSRGKVFLCEKNGVNFWMSRLWDQAESNSDDPIEDGLLPVVVKVTVLPQSTLEDDLLGSKDSAHKAYFVEEDVPAAGLQVWTGDRWDRISSQAAKTIVSQARERTEYLEEDGETYYYYDPDTFYPF